jgi:flavin-binding protein dodecin
MGLLGRRTRVTLNSGHNIISCFSASTKNFDDAIKSGIARAQKTLTKVQSAWIENQEVLLNGKGLIAEYRVQMKVTFILEE